MMNAIKSVLKRILPNSWVSVYHKQLAKFAAWRHQYPSEKLIIIGVTGTKGKSTTCNILWHILTQAGYKVGMATTANFRIGEKHWLNTSKMTMLGRTQLQELLAQMVSAGCQYAIVETSSEGIKQWRHLGVHYDVVAWTNLFPEHLDAHGGFENYKAAKLSLFDHLVESPTKIINGQTISKAAVLNGDSSYYPEFAEHAATPVKIVWSRQHNQRAHVQVENIIERSDGLDFGIGEYHFTSQLLGEWSLDNILTAFGVGLTQGLSYPELAQALQSFKGAPGRMESIIEGQPFNVIVDYAYEPVSLGLLYSFWRKLKPNNKLITLISSTGGGRDVARRFENGKVAGQLCDNVIVTDEDPYDDDPQVIIDQVAAGVAATGKQENINFWKILDRRTAITTAFRIAQPGDVVFLTCKGADQKICRAKGKKESWDDRTVAKEVLHELLRKTWG
ncbi:MAG: hypothetical protein ACD_43C00166G0007 [uncultured bacterium]|nr:MAG: hypothetical protein ACD_43C00166G0007 [uncultured bacterium]